MKVSPEYFIQLSHRVNTPHREKENLLKVQVIKDRKVIEENLLKVQVIKDRKVIESPSEKGQGNIVNPGQKTGSIFSYVY